MLKYILFVIAVLVIAAPSFAQVYQNQYDEMVAPLDRAINQVNEIYANVPKPGDDEDLKPQDQRYEEMTNAVNEANERHFEQGKNVKTIIEQEEK